MKITGSYLKELRRRKGITQRKLAELTGFSQAHIAKIENEKVDPRLSTVNKILEVLKEEKRCENIMTRNVISARPEQEVKEVAELMMREGISQVPVLEGDKVIGTITEKHLMLNLHKLKGKRVMDAMEPPLPILPKTASLEQVKNILSYDQAVLISDNGKIVGIITRSDLLKLI